MLLMTYVEIECKKGRKDPEKACISWTTDGRALIIRDCNELASRLLPKVFLGTGGRFSSFTRKLYRWGFRQKVINKRKKGMQPTTSSAKVFFHKFFQRDNKKLLAEMKSVMTEKAKMAILPPDQELKRLEAPEAGIPSQQNALLGFLSAHQSMNTLLPQQLWQAPAHPEASLFSYGRNPSSLTSCLAANPSLAALPMLEILARRQALPTAITPPFLYVTAERNLLRHDLALQAMQRKRVQDLITKNWQSTTNSLWAVPS
jgi:hypothetical protein